MTRRKLNYYKQKKLQDRFNPKLLQLIFFSYTFCFALYSLGVAPYISAKER